MSYVYAFLTRTRKENAKHIKLPQILINCFYVAGSHLTKWPRKPFYMKILWACVSPGPSIPPRHLTQSDPNQGKALSVFSPTSREDFSEYVLTGGGNFWCSELTWRPILPLLGPPTPIWTHRASRPLWRRRPCVGLRYSVYASRTAQTQPVLAISHLILSIYIYRHIEICM